MSKKIVLKKLDFFMQSQRRLISSTSQGSLRSRMDGAVKFSYACLPTSPPIQESSFNTSADVPT